MEAQKTVFRKDGEGNSLYVIGSTIYLQMLNAALPVRIGAFDNENKTILIAKEYYDYNEHYNCYPLNEAVLRAAKKCDTVTMTCPEGKYVTPISMILRYGTPLNFDTQDLSRQIFIKLELIKDYAR